MTQVDQVGFSCAACGKQYRWKPELAGKSVKCKCGSPIKVPRQMGAPAVAAPQAGIAAARSAADVPPRVPKPAKPKPRAEEFDGGGDLDALMALAQQEAASAEDAASQADSHFCANCRSRMSPEAVLCTNCGYDRRKGSVLAAAKVKDPNARRLFGLLGPKKAKSDKVLDAMAPQGSFLVGLCVSFGLALAASLIWFLVAWGVGWDVYFLVALVGVGAGVGMQIGQKGYSTMGGLAAVGVTLLVMIMARFAVIIAIVLPLMRAEDAAAFGEDEESAESERVEIQPFDPSNILKEREISGDGTNNAPINPNEDPRVVAMIAKQVYQDFHWNPEFASGDQHNAVDLEARIRAQTMPSDVKKKLIAEMDKKYEHERLIGMLIDEERDRILEANPEANLNRGVMEAVRTTVMTKVNKMTPADEAKERERLKAVQKAKAAKAATQYAEMEKKWKAEADKAAVADGFDSADAGEDEEAMEEGDEDGLDEDTPAGAPAVASTQGARPTPAAAASAAPASDAGADAEDEDADGPSTAVSIGLGAILLLIFFGGIKSSIFMIASLFLAYRTAAGSTWG